MDVTKNGNQFVIELAGRIDSGNASVLEKELLEFLGAHGDEEIVFDAEHMTSVETGVFPSYCERYLDYLDVIENI